MGIRDREFDRLVKYAEGHGLVVETRQHERNDPGAEYCSDTLTITLYVWPGQTMTRLIINFLHELGHHRDWILRGQQHSKVEHKALILENLRESSRAPAVKKKYRRAIYEIERDGIQHMIDIYNELDLKIPKYKILADMELDEWTYYFYYETGKDTTQLQRDKKSKELRVKYRGLAYE